MTEHPFAQYVRILGKGKSGSRSLTLEEARSAMTMLLNGEVEDVQLGAFLMLLRVKEESPEELAGFVHAVRDSLSLPWLSVDLDWASYAGKRRQQAWYLLAALALAKSAQLLPAVLMVRAPAPAGLTLLAPGQVLAQLAGEAAMAPVAAARLSFLMSMPAILGATGLELLQDREGALAGVAPAEFLLGMAAAAIMGFLALRWLLMLVEQRRFHWFAPYCGLVGLALLVL